MRFGIITLVSDNYGNKYQNYAVEQLMSEFGEVETFGLKELYTPPVSEEKSLLNKLKPSYIREVLIARPMYRYDINRLDKGILHNLLYSVMHGKALDALRQKRSRRFQSFAEKNLHIAKKRLDLENTTKEWVANYDFFVCGSDQIWNPTYRTTSELAFCSFAPEKAICLSPSFGLANIPKHRQVDYKRWLSNIKHLSVREEAGRQIIKELTGRDAKVFLDPTMLIPMDYWENLCRKPKGNLPKNYILCYFLGRITKEYKKKIDEISRNMGFPLVMLFDIMTPQYYTMDPAEVLYTIKNANCVLTDSFHGSVFSILFHRNFMVFKREEGGRSMNSRLETLLRTFQLESEADGSSIPQEKWQAVEDILARERTKVSNYLNIVKKNSE